MTSPDDQSPNKRDTSTYVLKGDVIIQNYQNNTPIIFDHGYAIQTSRDSRKIYDFSGVRVATVKYADERLLSICSSDDYLAIVDYRQITVYNRQQMKDLKKHEHFYKNNCIATVEPVAIISALQEYVYSLGNITDIGMTRSVILDNTIYVLMNCGPYAQLYRYEIINGKVELIELTYINNTPWNIMKFNNKAIVWMPHSTLYWYDCASGEFFDGLGELDLAIIYKKNNNSQFYYPGLANKSGIKYLLECNCNHEVANCNHEVANCNHEVANCNHEVANCNHGKFGCLSLSQHKHDAMWVTHDTLYLPTIKLRCNVMHSVVIDDILYLYTIIKYTQNDHDEQDTSIKRWVIYL